jgi:hypothetical protein
MEQLKVDLYNIYSSNTGKSLSARFLTYWSTAIHDDQRNMSDFERFITETEDYKSHQLALFKDVYYKHIGLSDFTSESFDNFFAVNKNKLVSKNTIEEYVFSMPQYIEKYSRLITKVFSLVKQLDTITPEVLAFYIHLFKVSPDYNIHKLEQHILEEFHSGGIHDVIPSKGMVSEQLPIAATKQQLTINNKFVEIFEDVFKRPIFIQEYIKYVNDQMFDPVRLYSVHQSNYIKMKEINSAYLDLFLTEYEYIKQFLQSMDDATFVTSFVNEVTNSSGYEGKMKVLISKKFKEMFDDCLENDDVCYVFKIIKENKLSLIDEDISNILVNFKQETDEIIQKIYNLYERTLCRHPDEYELEKDIVAFRSSQSQTGFVGAEKELEKELMVSIEYHDILKKHIKAQYSQKHASDALPSTLFKLLARAIEHVHSWQLSEVENQIHILLN